MRERQGRMLIQHVQEPLSLHLSCRMTAFGRDSKADQAKLGAGRRSLPAKDAHGKVCKGEANIEHTGVLLYPLVALP